MSVVLRVSTSRFHSGPATFDMIAEKISQGALICKHFTRVGIDCGSRGDLLLVNRLLVTGLSFLQVVDGGIKRSNEAVASCWHFLC